MDLFKKYLIVGGLPDAVNSFLHDKNVQLIREIQTEIHEYYAADAAKYDSQNKLKIERIYDLVPSNMENKKSVFIVNPISWTKYNWKDLWGFYYEIKFTR